ncbi:MAG: glycosyltransferase family 2 protein [Candidatus Zambryskibacteria bacterium]|nr:glycosyltransferase family 2 protein [Candidatus Zambryskibacteria bacterium]
MAETQTLILYFSLFISLFFEVFLLITYLEAREELKTEEDYLARGLKLFPALTVIVPCFNEEKTVAKTIKSILDLDYPKDKISIIAVNDGSTDKTLEVLRQFPQIAVLSKENGGKHTALNLALEHVTTDLVGCLDADSFVLPDTLKKIIPFFEDEKIMAVTPSIRVHEPKNILQYIQRVEYSWGIFLRRMLSSLNAMYVTPGPFSIFRTTVFRELGGYRAAYQTEDLEIALRMQKNRYKIVNSHGAHVYTIAPAKFKPLLKQRVRWSYGFLNNVIDYREMLLNPKYGHVGMFILPLGTMSIFSTLYMTSHIVWSWMSSIFNKIVKFEAIGLSTKFHMPHFDWYFLNTGVISVLTITAVIFTVIILYLALKLADGKFKFKKEILYYLFIYPFMVPFWLVKVLFDTAFRRKVSWR